MATVFRKGLDPKKIEAAIRHLNWSIDLHVNWLKYEQYGEHRNSATFVEGYDWEWDSSTCELKPVPPTVQQTKYAPRGPDPFGFPGNCYPDYQIDIDREMSKWYTQDPQKLNKAQRFLVSLLWRRVEISVYQLVYNSGNFALADEFLGAPTERMIKLLPDLRKLEQQYFTEIVIGKRPLEAFHEFVQEWWNRGGKQVTEDVNVWYKSQRR